MYICILCLNSVITINNIENRFFLLVKWRIFYDYYNIITRIRPSSESPFIFLKD